MNIKIIKQSDGQVWIVNEGITYRTNSNGRGLFKLNTRTDNFEQIAGTCQYALPANKSVRQILASYLKGGIK